MTKRGSSTRGFLGLLGEFGGAGFADNIDFDDPRVGWSSLFTLVVSIGPAVVLLASFLNPKAYWQVTKFDLCCGALSILAIILWVITQTGLVAIVLSITADFLAGIPTLIKAYRHPRTESANAYLAGIFSGGITLLTVHIWTFATYSFPLYIMMFCLLLFVLIKFPKFRPSQLQSQA